jgi:hypothetical protein
MQTLLLAVFMASGSPEGRMPSQNEDPIEFIQISTIPKSKQECEDIPTWPTLAFQDQGYIAVIEIAAQGYVAITKARSFMDVTEGDQPG